ncbi:MAG: hypothetical protein LBE13_04365 [Bacteroidales bacterium]|jgi:hypothetical protein|nr:hypothetical protein [Bacteroidales bacterium]
MERFKSYEDFKDDYEEHHYIDKVSNRYYPQKPLNTKQLQRYYLQYVRKWERANSKMESRPTNKSEDMVLYENILERDRGCRLLPVLTVSERAIWNDHQNGMGCILDGAHVFGKSAYPWMRYDSKNVVTLNRFSHSCLDLNKSPVDGHSISHNEKIIWWQRIIGKEDWNYLEELSRNRKELN